MSISRTRFTFPALITVVALGLSVLAVGISWPVPSTGTPVGPTGAGLVQSPAGPTDGRAVVPDPDLADQPTPDQGEPAGGRRGLPGATPAGARPPVVDHGPRVGNRVALTFDADMTDAMLQNLRSGRVRSYANLRIIEMLERERVPATFFLTGKWVQRYPELTRRLAANPRFELANHTYGHHAFTTDCYGLPHLPSAKQTDDVARTFRLIEPYGGRQTRYFRFPGLCHDPAALTALAPLGLTVVDGDVVSGDPFATAWQPIVRAVLTQVRPGSVVIMHVTEANAAMTDEALPHILQGLRERGLVPAALSEVLSASDG